MYSGNQYKPRDILDCLERNDRQWGSNFFWLSLQTVQEQTGVFKDEEIHNHKADTEMKLKSVLAWQLNTVLLHSLIKKQTSAY